MAEAQTATAVQTPPTESAAPPPTDWDQSLAALNETMREAEIAANAQRDLEEAGIPIDEPAEAEPAEPESDEAELPETVEPEPAEASPADKAPEQSPQPQGEQKRYSRRDAARLDNELQETTRRLNETQSRVAHYEQTEREIIGRLAQLTGSDGTYDQLLSKAARGQITRDEQAQLQRMTETREAAAPIYRVAQEQVWEAFRSDWQQLKSLDGITDSVMQELNALPNPAHLMRRIFELGQASGERRKAREAERLTTAVTDLRTKTAATKPQPVPASVGAPTNGRTIDRVMERAFKRGPNGELEINPEFDRHVGEFTGVDLSR